LTPTDFGQVAIVLSIMAFLQVFSDAGVSSAIIHHRDITHGQLSSLYWLNVATGTGLALLLAVTSPFIARWYQEPIVGNLTIIAALSLVLGGLGQQLRVSAQKDLQFASLAKVELFGAITGFITAVGMAWHGAGAYSIALGALCSAGAGCLLSWVLLAKGWRPSLVLNIREIKPFLQFGGYVIGNNLANTFNHQVDILIGTRILGAGPIGTYSVPKSLMWNIQAVINPIITQVGFPIMAKVQHDQAMLRRIYLTSIRMTASVNFPIYLGIAFFAQEIVDLLLGGKWKASVPLLQVFAWWGLFRSIGNPVGSLLYATGRADLSFKWNMVMLLIMGPIIWLGSTAGVQGMALVMAGLMAALYLPTWFFLVRPLCGAKFVEYSSQILIPFVISLASVSLMFFLISPLRNEWARLMTGGLGCLLLYLLGSWYGNREWVNAMLELLGKRQASV
jgi:O-antigen/teichoic acid export membrane protein